MTIVIRSRTPVHAEARHSAVSGRPAPASTRTGARAAQKKPRSGPIRPVVVIADAQALTRRGLAGLVEGLLGGCLVLEAADGDELAALIETGPRPDLVIVDPALPGLPGSAGTAPLAMLKRRIGAATLVALLGAADGLPAAPAASAHAAPGFGADAAIARDAGVGPLVEALAAALGIAAAAFRERPALIDAATASKVYALSPQVQRVFWMLGDGLFNKEIAYRLGIGESTVKAHMSKLLAALGCASRTRAALIACRLSAARGGAAIRPERAA